MRALEIFIGEPYGLWAYLVLDSGPFLLGLIGRSYHLFGPILR